MKLRCRLGLHRWMVVGKSHHKLGFSNGTFRKVFHRCRDCMNVTKETWERVA